MEDEKSRITFICTKQIKNEFHKICIDNNQDMTQRLLEMIKYDIELNTNLSKEEVNKLSEEHND
jgi:hypothetical protein